VEFKEFLKEYKEWVNYNFPNSTAGDQLLGIVEECGELSHHILKGKQGIRGTPEEHDIKAQDSVGDLIIFLVGFCLRKGWDLDEIIQTTWQSVKTRDWKKFPTNGRDK
jgi:NTP pyrophosphatase (non-canonical NTP hydrolase)